MENNPLEWVANRLFASWRTTVLGLGLLVLLLVLGFTGVKTWEQLEGYFFASVFFFFTRDSKAVDAQKAAAVDKALEKAGVPPEERPAPPQ